MADLVVRHFERTNNSLLADMPDSEWERVRADLQLVQFGTGDVLYERNELLEYLYFPRRGCVSMVIDFDDGFQSEAGLVGYEGMVGVPLIYGVKSDVVRAVAQAPSEALRLRAGVFARELGQMPVLSRTLLRYAEAMRTQALQLAACNSHHGLDARLARCLLTMQDRHRENQLPVTHELLASLLSAHRPSVSVAAKRLQGAGLIRYASGHVLVADRPGLEGAACECYQVIRERVQSLLGQR